MEKFFYTATGWAQLLTSAIIQKGAQLYQPLVRAWGLLLKRMHNYRTCWTIGRPSGDGAQLSYGFIAYSFNASFYSTEEKYSKLLSPTRTLTVYVGVLTPSNNTMYKECWESSSPKNWSVDSEMITKVIWLMTIWVVGWNELVLPILGTS